MDYLKRAKVRIESINEEIEIVQLHAKAQAEAIDAYKQDSNRFMGGFVTIKYGVPAWSERTPEELSTLFSLAQMNEIVGAINDLSGIEAKNSDSTLSESSSSS